MQEYFSCIYEKADGLDDGVSDARTVGRSAAMLCREKLQDAAETFTRGARPRVYQMTFEALLHDEEDNGAAAVLKLRASKR